jgi:DNA adenine methylase
MYTLLTHVKGVYVTKSIKSPLRYPGGKSRAIKTIMPHIPADIREFREPFIGGGSVFLAVKSGYGDLIENYWINDLNHDLFCFWQFARDANPKLVETVQDYRDRYPDGRDLYAYLKDDANMQSDFDRAVRFFIMNRITFSGVMDSGGYSNQAFHKRFTPSSIDRLAMLAGILQNTTITNADYASVVGAAGDGAFIFLDPPYFSATQSKLYGVKGDLHVGFDHQRFADDMRNCSHRWLITYDDSPEIRELFGFATIIPWELQYGMNNFKQERAAKGKELFIKNY